jgi:hypothetical protein
MAETPPTPQDTQANSPLIAFDYYLGSTIVDPLSPLRTK